MKMGLILVPLSVGKNQKIEPIHLLTIERIVGVMHEIKNVKLSNTAI
jgi:hypothetical protein